ncbi:MAG: hypothetical protein AB7F50_01035 [Fimbriimonadaceae bacterium]
MKTKSQVAKTTTSLKLRAVPKKNALSIRIGTRKFTLPFEARILSSDNYVFVHVPPSAMLMKMDGKGLSEVTTDTEAKEASASFRKSRAKTGRKSSKKTPELPAEIHNLLGKIPAGYRLDVARDGTPRIVRTRNRRPSAAKAKSVAPKVAKVAKTTKTAKTTKASKTAKPKAKKKTQ